MFLLQRGKEGRMEGRKEEEQVEEKEGERKRKGERKKLFLLDLGREGGKER